jgi:hypothetical protein
MKGSWKSWTSSIAPNWPSSWMCAGVVALCRTPVVRCSALREHARPSQMMQTGSASIWHASGLSSLNFAHRLEICGVDVAPKLHARSLGYRQNKRARFLFTNAKSIEIAPGDSLMLTAGVCQCSYQSECGDQPPHLRHWGSAHIVNASWIAIRDSKPFL